MPTSAFYNQNEFPAEPFQVMNEDGEIVNQEAFNMVTAEQLVDFYEWMLKIRIADARANNLQRVGRMGTYPSVYGQEACQVGPGLALQKEDWLVPTFRETGTMWCFGVPLDMTFMYWMGNEMGSKMPDDVNCLPIAITVGGHLPHAAGIAWANKLQQKKSAVLCSFSDGASSEGDFHAALNFSGVLDLPTVYYLQNNQYAISTHRELQTVSKTFAQKAFAYGIDGALIDGNDVIATYLVTKEALRMAREENKPSLIEAVTYRLGNHTSSDNAKLYREDSEVEAWAPKEPLIRLKKYLISQGLWSDEKEEAHIAACKETVNTIADNALNHPLLDPKNMFDQLYAEKTPQLVEQQNDFIQELTQMKSDRLS